MNSFESALSFADRILLDDTAWRGYMIRCAVIAKTGLYGHATPESVAVAGLRGMSMGLPFMQSLELIKVIHGRPQIRGPQAVALIRARVPSAHLECVESTSERSTWAMARDAAATPKMFTATIQEAQDAGLLTSNVWKKYPAKMLKWWAASAGTAELFGDVLCGVAVATENSHVPDISSGLEITEGNKSEITGDVVDAEIVSDSETHAGEIADTVAKGNVALVDGKQIRARSLKREDGVRCLIEALERDENGRNTWGSIWYSPILQPEEAQSAVFDAARAIATQGIDTARAASAWNSSEKATA